MRQPDQGRPGIGNRGAASLRNDAGIQAASAGMVNDNPMTPTWWKFAQEYVNAHKK